MFSKYLTDNVLVISQISDSPENGEHKAGLVKVNI